MYQYFISNKHLRGHRSDSFVKFDLWQGELRPPGSFGVRSLALACCTYCKGDHCSPHIWSTINIPLNLF